MKTLALCLSLVAVINAAIVAGGSSLSIAGVLGLIFAIGWTLLLISDYHATAAHHHPCEMTDESAPVRRIRPECPVYTSKYGSLIIFDTTVV